MSRCLRTDCSSCRITEQDILKAIQARDVDIQDIPHEFVYMSDFESAHEAINASIKKYVLCSS